ncbi:2-hydroxyacid dehydrogenase [Isoptericola sp. b441]|uniref:2-hydroxyacid dehydrogenase n=1 Tax=Actinotalea lenta TaxID=3064654 RepID=A0ABT9DBI1_9CELL|nr:MULTISPECIES: 2-hydroxyacid dehydrogenase [unclassified Isoptericola]MDO8108225.1 2-hydroxyacid dehydrogenase [Isoptericola sp. b441]MDO8120103.1 2-hydroxyacid dehydrogenase [Isoptericola sp. b490]
MITATVAHPELLDPLTDDPVDGVRLVSWDMRAPLPPEVATEVDVVVVPHYFVRPEGFRLLADLPRLSVVQLPSAGFEYALDLVPPHVTLCNGKGVHDAGTAELAIGLLLAQQRGIADAVRDMAAHRWAPVHRPSLADRRVMVLGYGSIGSAIARRLDALEVEVVPVATRARTEDGRPVHALSELPALLPTVDAVVVMVPLTTDTEHLVDAAFLAALPDGALLVNMARGKVVDTEALLAELTSGRLRAALDVTDPEPLPSDHPLWDAPNLVVTPHVGGYTDATHPRFAALMRRQLTELAAGRPPINVVRGPDA